MPTILVTNDDGIQSPGLFALKKALESIADVIVMAPERNWSASSHIKTMHKPLRVHKVTLEDGSVGYSSSGSPTDCVTLVMGGVLGIKPDLVVSGINAGHNIGIDITYSGTVACAMEAVIKGVPGIAVSTCYAVPAEFDAEIVRKTTAEFARGVAVRVLATGLPPHTLLNLNVPCVAPDQIKGVRLTHMGGRHYDADEVIERHDPHGRPYYWLGGTQADDGSDLDSDAGAVKHGYVSLTPITLDMTHYDLLARMRSDGLDAQWSEHGF